MPYSVMIWLVNAGEQKYETETVRRISRRRQDTGTSSGVNVPPAFTRLSYGLYDSYAEADRALSEIAENLRTNTPLQITRKENRTFLVPAGRVHYVVCEEVTRPKDAQRQELESHVA